MNLNHIPPILCRQIRALGSLSSRMAMAMPTQRILLIYRTRHRIRCLRQIRIEATEILLSFRLFLIESQIAAIIERLQGEAALFDNLPSALLAVEYGQCLNRLIAGSGDPVNGP